MSLGKMFFFCCQLKLCCAVCPAVFAGMDTKPGFVKWTQVFVSLVCILSHRESPGLLLNPRRILPGVLCSLASFGLWGWLANATTRCCVPAACGWLVCSSRELNKEPNVDYSNRSTGFS